MFEVPGLGYSVERAVYNEISALLRTELLTVQDRLKAIPFAVIILISGEGRGDKSRAIKRLEQDLARRSCSKRLAKS